MECILLVCFSVCVHACLIQELGSYLASKEIAVVYGGGNCGMMGKLAHSVLAGGGNITGVIPEFFTSELISAAPEEVVIISSSPF